MTTSDMYEIALLGQEFFAYHGVYEQERQTGNKFIVDIKVQLEESLLENTGDQIGNVVDYVSLYTIAASVMQQPVNLLETVALEIINPVLNLSPSVICAEVTISKLNPPVEGICRESRVTIRRNRKG